MFNAQKFSEYFGGVPIVEAKGWPYPVEVYFSSERIDSRRMLEKATDLALSIYQGSQASNMLIFMPGKQEINAIIEEMIKQKITGAIILLLHS